MHSDSKCCGRKSRAAYAQSFALWQQATIEFTYHDHSIIAFRATYMYGVVLHAHPVRGESHNQRNTTGEVATTSPHFYNEAHRSHVLCVKAELRTTFTSWSQHHFVAIGNPERHMRKASHCGSKQQENSHTMITLLLLVRATYMYGIVLHAHPVRGESHNQRNTTGEVATEVSQLVVQEVGCS